MMSDFNVDNVVPTLLQDGAILIDRNKVARGLNIPEHQLIQWNDQYRSEAITMEEFFRRMLTQWKSQMGVEANTTSLSNILRKCGFNTTADVLLTFSTVISTTGTLAMYTVLPPIYNFVGRINELDHLLQLFKENNRLSVVISAIGGQGKTELCRKFIQQHVKDKNLVITWLSGDSAQTFVVSLLDYASTMKLSLDKSHTLATLIDKVAGQLKHNSKWLVVIDNVESSYEELTLAVQTFLRHNAFILVTSRRSDILTDSEHIELQPLEDTDAVGLVEKALNHKNDVVKFYNFVGNHPLALQQAVAYIKHQKGVEDFMYSISNYLKDLSSGMVEVLDYQAQSFEYKTTTLKIVNSLLKQIRDMDEKEGAKAFTLLHVLTLLDGTAIALDFLKHLFSKIECESVFKKSVQVLKKLSLVKVENNVLSTHQLFQLVSFHCIRKDESYNWAEVTDKLLTNLEKEMSNISEENIGQVVKIWSNASGILDVLGCQAQSFECETNTLKIVNSLLKKIKVIDEKEGAKSLSLLHVLSIYDSAGIGLDFLKYLFSKVESESVFKKSVEVLKKLSLVKVENNVLVIHQLFQLVSLHCLKKDESYQWERIIYNLLNNLSQLMSNMSEENIRQVVKIWINATAMQNFNDLQCGLVIKICDRLSKLTLHQESINFAENVSKIFSELLGNDHEGTLTIAHYWTSALEENGEYEKCLDKLKEVLETDKKTFGEDDYFTMVTKQRIAKVLVKQGKRAEALPIYKQVLIWWEKEFGHEHPHTVNTRNDFGYCLFEEEKFVEAKEELQQVLELRAKLLGEEHADTLNTKYLLAHTLHYLEKIEELETLVEVFSVQEKN